MALWTPAELETDLVQYDASDSASITLDTGLITQIADKLGSGRNATQSTSGARPALTGSAMVFDGTDDFLTLGTALGKPTSYTIFVVSKITKALSNDQALIYSCDSSGLSSGWGSITSYSTVPGALLWMYGDSGSNYRYAAASSAFVVNTKAQHCVVHTDGVTAETAYLNGAALSNGSLSGTATAVSGTAQTMSIGRLGGYTTGYYFGGEIYEVIIALGALSTNDIDKVFGYAAHKWDDILGGTVFVDALPVGHPYKESAPIDQEVGNIVAPLPIISGDATNAVVGVGSIVAKTPTIGGKVWNAGTGEVTATICQLSGTAENQVPAIGRITIQGKVSGAAYNPVASVAGVTARLPRISGRAVNQELVSGGVTARGRVFGRATNPKAFEPIRFRRCGS